MNDYTGGENGYTPLLAAPDTPYDISNTPQQDVLNYEGTPTQFSDASGLRALLTRNGIMDVSSFNPIVQPGEKITANTPRQAVNADGQLLFLDANGEQTTRPTDSPMVGGTIGDAAYMEPAQYGGGALGSIGYDLKSAATDPELRKGLTAAAIAAAAVATGGALAPELTGAEGALGAGALGGAEAFPVASGALIPGTELGAVGTGAGALGVAGGDIGAFTAADALASAAGGSGGVGALGAGGAGAGALGAGGVGAGGLTDAEATLLMENNLLPAGMQIPASEGLTAADALKYANLAKSALGATGNATAGSGGGGGSVNPNGAWNNNGQALAPQIISSAIHEQKPIVAGDEKLPMLFPSLDPALARQFAMSGNTGSNLGGNYFAYGSPPANSPLNSPLAQAAPTYMKGGGGVLQSFREGGMPHIPEFITGATGHYVKGRGDGQSDEIPAMLANGEYVFDADTVAQLGNGSSDAGAKVLDKMREALRHHKRSAPVDSIPPKAKSPLEYIKQGMKRT